MNADYQFDDEDKSLPLWRVKYQKIDVRLARMPFFKMLSIVRAKNREEAKNKVISFWSHPIDRVTASKVSEKG